MFQRDSLIYWLLQVILSSGFVKIVLSLNQVLWPQPIAPIPTSVPSIGIEGQLNLVDTLSKLTQQMQDTMTSVHQLSSKVEKIKTPCNNTNSVPISDCNGVKPLVTYSEMVKMHIKNVNNTNHITNGNKNSSGPVACSDPHIGTSKHGQNMHSNTDHVLVLSGVTEKDKCVNHSSFLLELSKHVDPGGNQH